MIEKIMVISLMCFLPLMSLAEEALSNQYLQRAINELEAAKVYIQKAKSQEAPNQRVVFHYEKLLSDINKIESGIQRKFYRLQAQPRVIKPLSGDYLGILGQEKTV